MLSEAVSFKDSNSLSPCWTLTQHKKDQEGVRNHYGSPKKSNYRIKQDTTEDQEEKQKKLFLMI